MHHGLKRSLAILWTLAIAISSVAFAEVPSSEQLLKTLRERDAKFDNVHLEYLKTGIRHIKPSVSGIYRRDGTQLNPVEAQDLELRYNMSLILRGGQVTTVSSADPELHRKQRDSGKASMGLYNKFSTADGTVRSHAVVDPLPAHAHAILDISPLTDAQKSLLEESLMSIQFTFGFGYGNRIRSIDRIEQDGSNLKIHGIIRIWDTDDSEIQMTLDEHDLVREAVIKIDTSKGKVPLTIMAKTEGTVAANGFEMAKTGSYEAGARTERFNVEFQKATFNLSDEQYKKLIDITPDFGTQVNDRIANAVFFVGEPAPARPITRESIPPAP